MREAEFQVDVIKAATLFGLATYHTYDSRRSGAGFPDLTIVGANGILFRELKTDVGRVSPQQQYWLAVLVESGADAKVWRPSDWPTITSELRALGRLAIQPPEPTQAQLRKMLKRPR